MKEDLPKLQAHLRKVFKTDAIRVAMHGRKKDMAEVFMGPDQIAQLYRDEEDGEVSYQLQMAILDIDLEEA
jgi:Protein of unknown function (DUF3126)